MKILAISDTHGHLPEIPECDLLLIGGDICPDFEPCAQHRWLDGPFRQWLRDTPASKIVGIAGNHDFIFQNRISIDKLFLPWVYLQDSAVTLDGVKIYGIPWVPKLCSWAFYANDAQLRHYYECVPDDTDIVLSHGPPHGLGDLTTPFHGSPFHGSVHAGCKHANTMMERVKPTAFVCGHIHEARGLYRWIFAEVYNVSYVNEAYVPRSEDPVVEIIL